jgi:uncharacterized membrane-anchored protein YhcB (DUF1043 family)
MSLGERIWGVVLLLLLVVPIAAVCMIAYCFAELVEPAWLPHWAAIAVGLLIGAAIIRLSVAMSGTDFMDWIVTPGIILVLTVILYPVFVRAKANALRHKNHAAQMQTPTRTPQR